MYNIIIDNVGTWSASTASQTQRIQYPIKKDFILYETDGNITTYKCYNRASESYSYFTPVDQNNNYVYNAEVFYDNSGNINHIYLCGDDYTVDPALYLYDMVTNQKIGISFPAASAFSANYMTVPYILNINTIVIEYDTADHRFHYSIYDIPSSTYIPLTSNNYVFGSIDNLTANLGGGTQAGVLYGMAYNLQTSAFDMFYAVKHGNNYQISALDVPVWALSANPHDLYDGTITCSGNGRYIMNSIHTVDSIHYLLRWDINNNFNLETFLLSGYTSSFFDGTSYDGIPHHFLMVHRMMVQRYM